jgi:glycosyltransferase involved in cell wall biosynthesis
MKKVLIITYYWPPSGGSGVQRWMYFCKYLKEFGIIPIVITVDETKASYRYYDESFNELVKNVEVHRTNTREPLKLYSKIVSGNNNSAIPIGFAGESEPNIFQKFSRFIRGNVFIPDARVGWVKYAFEKAKEIILKEKINLVITNGPPHSTHFAGLKLKEECNIQWLADFRDPWTDLHYNKYLYRTKWAQQKDARFEKEVLTKADGILTIGPSMKKHLMVKGNIDASKIEFIYNGFDEDDFKNVEPSEKSEFLTISHIGMLSDSQPITSFLKALKYFYDTNHPICNHLKLQLIGNVSPKNLTDVQEIVPGLPLSHIGYVQKKTAIEYMLGSDLLLNSLAEMVNSELLISGKLMEYIATAKPILCLGNPNGDAAYLLKDYEKSGVYSRNDVEGMIAYLNKLFANWMNKTNFAVDAVNVSQYSRYETTRQLSNILKKYL